METYYAPNDDLMGAELESSLYWKPQVNVKYKLRIGPPWSPSGMLFKVRATHFGLKEGDNFVRAVCLDVHDKAGTCPVCRYSRMLDGRSDKRAKTVARELRAAYAYHYNVLVRGQEQVGWRVYAAPKSVAKQLHEFANDLRGDGQEHYVHPDKGRDIILVGTGEGFQRKWACKLDPAGATPCGTNVPPNNLDELVDIQLLPAQYLIEVITACYGDEFAYA